MSLTRKTIVLFWQHARRYPLALIGVIFFIPVSILFNTYLPPVIASGVIERISVGNFTHGDLWGSFGASLGLYALFSLLGGVVFWRIAIILLWRLEMKVMRDLARRVYEHLINQSSSFHANRFGGSLVSQANKLLGAYMRLADTFFFDVLILLVSFVFTGVILWPKAPIYVIVLLGGSLVYMAGMYLFSKPVLEATAKEAKASNRQTGYLADSITNVMAIKSFATEAYEAKRYQLATNKTFLASNFLLRTTFKRDLVSSGFTAAISAVSLAIAAASVVIYKADVATVFLIYTFTAGIVMRLWQFSSSVLRNYNRSMGDAREMVEILDSGSEVKDPTNPIEAQIKKGEIRFKDVVFAHADAGETLFNKLNLHIASGKKIGLVGHSGSGKTSLTKILLRFVNINGGQILIDNQDITMMRQVDLRQHIAYVPQEPLLFHRSIFENIAYGKEDATAEQVELAAKQAHAAEFIKTLPKGYDTLVGERGIKLSGGQRQRIAIARAMLKDAPILVLDEATSALDSESELLIQDALWQLMKGRTTIVIAHRLSTVQKMDEIVVIEKGKIIEQGSHKKLLAKNGVYATLWAHQSGDFIKE